jgi:NTE family protein
MLGLALEGGGAKGAFHMGVYKALLEEGYEFGGITGTSIGALNGAIIAQGDFEAGYKLWEIMDSSLLFDIDEIQMKKILDKKVDKETLAYLSSKIKSVFENKGIDTSKIRIILNNIIDEEKLRKSKIDLGIVTVSVTDLMPLELYKEDIPQGKIVDYLMASANMPLFKIEPIDGKRYIDGAFYDNCPVNLLVRKGYKEIIAVRTFGIGITRKIEDVNVKVTNIIPSENLGGTLNFDNVQIQTNLKMGYCDAMRVIKKLIGKTYYIKSEDEESFFSRAASIPEDLIYKIGDAMRLPKMEPRRMLFEKIFPALAGNLSLPINSIHQDIIIGLMELLAKDRNVDRYKIRSFDGFIEDINNNSSNNYGSTKKAKLFPTFRKEPYMIKVGEEFLNAFIMIKEKKLWL